MKINYGLWWKENKAIIHRNYSIEHEMDLDNQEDHEKFRQLIRENHPNAHIHGYAIAEEESNK